MNPTTVSHYQILRKLGAGGMGDVFLAQDSRLGRKVALKAISDDLTGDKQATHRFEQEAKTVSALNHRNIVTIHDVVTDGSRTYIVMEYVDGVTLRTLLQRGPVDPRRALDIAAQVATGLAAASDAHIIHRDIKPENIIVAESGQVKILDFGLAKLNDPGTPMVADSSTTLARPMANETAQGTITGTVPYMSPEQVEGRPLDNRTDIFSLGVVLFEMLTGRHPFAGKTSLQTLHAIAHEDPKLPDTAADILEKALAKDPAERYRHAADLALDLRRLKIRSVTSDAHGALPASRSKSMLIGLMLAMIAALAGAALTWQLTRSATEARPEPDGTGVSITPMTSDPGYEGEATFAPDGQTIAYVSDRSGNLDVYVKQISGGADINITNHPGDDVQPSFSPDGKLLAFVSTRASPTGALYFGYDVPLMGGGVWVMPALGGNARRVAAAGNFPSWSPDGSHLLYTGGLQRHQKIYRAPSSGGEAQPIPLAFRASEGAHRFLLYPSYSPDGRWIAFEADFATDNFIYVVPTIGGEPKQIARGKRPAWRGSPYGIVYSNTEPGKNQTLWEVPFSTVDGVAGKARALTQGRGRDAQAAVSRDGRFIAFTAMEIAFHPESVLLDGESGRLTGPAEPLLRGSDIVYFMNPSPDGASLVYEGNRGARSHIWRLDRGTAAVQLTADPRFRDMYPRWSPDGALIAFIRRPVNQSTSSLWVMAADGGNPRQIVNNVGPFSFGWGADGKGIVYFAPSDGQLHLFTMTSGTTRKLTQEPGISFLPLFSHDGKWIVYQSAAAGNIDLRAMPADGGPSRVVVATTHHDLHPFLSPDDRWLYFQRDHKNIYRSPGPAQDWRRATPQQVTTEAESNLFLEDPQLSPDGKLLLYSRGRITGDLWIMEIARDEPAR